ncbi:UDP-glycosyltransferase UGT5 isoform X1 [Anabrus simplex]|uniref:UDP-glycosyltransferase UGT5 isoform X1 n=2 Tax=Anabrus simplex TaxID=316456 RepID=UPI0035A2C514
MMFQMQWSYAFTVLVLLASYRTSDSARILAIFHYNGKSQFSMLENLMKGLAAKGHDVYVASHFPQKNKIPNYTDINLNGSLPEVVNNFTVDFVRYLRPRELMNFLRYLNLEGCKASLNHPAMKDLMKSNDTFDVLITGFLGGDCWIALAHKWKIPIISVISTSTSPWVNDRLMNPDNPSYIPNYFLSYTSEMNFKQRLINTIYYAITKWGQYYLSELPIDLLLRQHFGDDIPPVSELKKNTSLVLINSHFSIHRSRPTVPAYVEVAGLHIATPKPLPEDLDKFLSEAPDGVIYFSFGSLIKCETLPKEKLQAFVDAFKLLPQRVLWKIDGSLVKGLPPNVKTSKWLPQLDVLVHPNVRVFISHGGLMGSLESVYAGVPVVGIPMFFDQMQNVEYLSNIGIARKVDYEDITKDTVYFALKSILEDPSYKRTAKLISERFRDRPQSALETAIFWTEYVIRHGGGAHLRSAAVDMPMYQYLLLDVIAVITLGLVSLLVLMWFMCKRTARFIFASEEDEKGVSKKKA